MISRVLIYLYITNSVNSQLNGEFWWLNKKLAQVQNIEPPPPKFDDTNEFETDESIKIIFRDNEITSDESSLSSTNNSKESQLLSSHISFQDENGKLINPIHIENNIHINKQRNYTQNNTLPKVNLKTNNNLKNNLKPDNEDVFYFTFPLSDEFNKQENRKSENNTIIDDSTVINTKLNSSKKSIATFETQNHMEETESICTFITQKNCLKSKGVVHMSPNPTCSKHLPHENQKVCCVLPLSANFSSKIIFPENPLKIIKRHKRSLSVENISTSPAMKQRNVLLQRKLSLGDKMEPAASTTQTKTTQNIVTPENNNDPYWNVKNSRLNKRIKYPHSSGYRGSIYDYSSSDYEDYVVELPKPGLVGLYSDLGPRQTTWKLSNNKKGFSYDGVEEISEEDSDDNAPFGYSTFDPRFGNRVATSRPRPIRKESVKITATLDDVMDYTESQIIFHSNPDFRVLEGFKLINLVGNKNRIVRTTTQSDKEDMKYELASDRPCNMADVNIEDFIDLENQVYQKCGKITSLPDKFGSMSEYSDPWLALVMRTKSRHSMLCYATIIHPRVAVTAADCVYKTPPGEISILSGMRKFNGDRTNTQQRFCTVHVHPDYKPDDFDNDIALLHWKRPLRMEANVQPACLGDPHVGDQCYFVGFGGYDQEIKQQARRQAAKILKPRDCRQRISKPDISLPHDAFCAAVTDLGTVTGVGGPLLCRNGDYTSLVGVAVWREDVVVMLPAYQWVTMTVPDILDT